MKRLYAMLAALAVLAAAGPAGATIVYTNNFDAENGGMGAAGYDSFTGLSVPYPFVDLIRSGDAGVTCAGGTGSCVDLDGGLSGQLRSDRFGFNAGDRVTLTFSASGSQRASSPLDEAVYAFRFDQPTTGTFTFASTYGLNVADSFDATFENGFEPGTFDFGLNAAAPWDLGFHDVAFSFTPTTRGTFSFLFDDYTPGAGDFDDDDAGRVIDNIALDVTAVPEPSTWGMAILGVGVIGGAARRRRRPAAGGPAYLR